MDPSRFEEPIVELEAELAKLPESDDAEIVEMRAKIEHRIQVLREEIFADLDAWQKTLVARHARRPHTSDYVEALIDDFVEIHGDRKFSDDPAILCGTGRFGGVPVLVIGHEKGRDTKEKIRRNFGMPRPEGYRKALRVMQLADKFRRPILCFVDTPGAYPGLGAEERGQAEAIALNLREMAKLRVPVLVTVTGEGGSGGALAIGVGNRVNMLEHSVYSVISPEGCAAILWRDPQRSADAAAAMRITAGDLKQLGIIDEIIEEAPGGAHADPRDQARRIGAVLKRQLDELMELDGEALMQDRHDRFRRLGVFEVA